MYKKRTFEADTNVVYKLMQGKEVVYVGQTINLGARVREHKRDKEFDTVEYFEVPEKNTGLLEGVMIKFFNPPLNGYLPPADGEYCRLETSYTDVRRLRRELSYKIWLHRKVLRRMVEGAEWTGAWAVWYFVNRIKNSGSFLISRAKSSEDGIKYPSCSISLGNVLSCTY